MERMSRRHVPNRFPAALRAMLLVFSVLALFYAVAELAIGYTYLPGKRGGMLLSGVPTLCIAAGSLLLCLSALLVVVDHYDTRDNEGRYKRLRAQALKTGAVLIVIAPLIEIALIFVRVGSGAEPLSPAGFAADVTWHDGTMKPYAGKVAAITDSGFFMGTLGDVRDCGGCHDCRETQDRVDAPVQRPRDSWVLRHVGDGPDTDHLRTVSRR